jgi:hypothetical protein
MSKFRLRVGDISLGLNDQLFFGFHLITKYAFILLHYATITAEIGLMTQSESKLKTALNNSIYQNSLELVCQRKLLLAT